MTRSFPQKKLRANNNRGIWTENTLLWIIPEVRKSWTQLYWKVKFKHERPLGTHMLSFRSFVHKLFCFAADRFVSLSSASFEISTLPHVFPLLIVFSFVITVFIVVVVFHIFFCCYRNLAFFQSDHSSSGQVGGLFSPSGHSERSNLEPHQGSSSINNHSFASSHW